MLNQQTYINWLNTHLKYLRERERERERKRSHKHFLHFFARNNEIKAPLLLSVIYFILYSTQGL